MPLDPAKLQDLRQRVLNEQPWTEEEMALAIREMCQDRLNNLEMPKAKGKASTKKPATSLDDLL